MIDFSRQRKLCDMRHNSFEYTKAPIRHDDMTNIPQTHTTKLKMTPMIF